jgi:uncharacterized protein (DUF697 family)
LDAARKQHRRRQLLGIHPKKLIIYEGTMHNIDRVRLETQSQTEMLGAGPFEAEQFEFAEAESPYQAEAGEVFGELEQMELASEMLEISSEAELDRFLGDVIQRAGQAVGKFVGSPEGQALGGVLKGAARQVLPEVLPAVGSAVGSYFGGPTGAKWGGRVGSAAGKLFGLELEGLSAEDQEFELARRYVSFAGEAVKNLALAPSGSDPRTAASTAAALAAQTHAPGLLQPRGQTGAESPAASRLPSGHSGRWMRRGNKIVLYGI